MSMLVLWAVFVVAFGWRVKQLDRWAVLTVLGFCAANVAVALLGFGPAAGP